MNEKKNHLFLCHSSRDKVFVKKLANDLESMHVKVWLDDWELGVGDSLHRCVGEALLEASYIAVVLSPDSIESKWCQDELEQALTIEKRLDKIIVFPLICRPVKLPPFLDGRLYLDLTSSYFPSLTHLSGIVLNVDKASLLRRISKRPPKSFRECLSILSDVKQAAFKNLTIKVEDYIEIRDILSRYGIHIPSDRFNVSSLDRRIEYEISDAAMMTRPR